MIAVSVTGHLLTSVSKLRGVGIGRGIGWNEVLLTRSWRENKGEFCVFGDGMGSNAVPLRICGIVRRVWWIEHLRGRGEMPPRC